MPCNGTIRGAEARDVTAMVELSEQKRLEYQAYEPRFWRKAADSREKQTPYLERLLTGERTLAFVHERDAGIDGFIIGALMDAPPVYDPAAIPRVSGPMIYAIPGFSTTLMHSSSFWSKVR